MSEQKIKNEISLIKKRLDDLERLLSTKKSSSMKPVKKEKYVGLVGGIQLLIDNKFFTNPKSLNEISKELKTNTYHYSLASISKILAKDFVRKKHSLNRIREGKLYRYVIRK